MGATFFETPCIYKRKISKMRQGWEREKDRKRERVEERGREREPQRRRRRDRSETKIEKETSVGKREEDYRDWRENSWKERQEWEREIGIGEIER